MCYIRVDMVALTGQVQGRVNGLWGMLERLSCRPRVSWGFWASTWEGGKPRSDIASPKLFGKGMTVV